MAGRGGATDPDLDLIAHAARAAGAEARNLQGRLGASDIRIKDDSSPVTSADLIADRVLKDMLLSARPDYGWLSEESDDDGARLTRARTFVVDPIDGTKAFIEGQDSWVVSVAVVEAGTPVAGVLFQPATDTLFDAAMGTGARRNEAPLSVRDRGELAGSRIVCPHRHLAPEKWRTPWPEIETVYPNSMAYRLALVAEGGWHGALALSAKRDWDLAAADLIVREAGGVITGLDGAPFRYNQMSTRKPGVVCGAPQFHAALMRRLGERIGDGNAG